MVLHLPRMFAMVTKFLCVKEIEQFYLLFFSFIFLFIFILLCIYFSIFNYNQGRLRKILKQLNIHCHSYLVTKQLYHMHGVRVLTVSDRHGKTIRCRPRSDFVSS